MHLTTRKIGGEYMSINTVSEFKDKNVLFDHNIHLLPDDNKFVFHTHDICEMIFLKKGDVSGIINGKVYKLQKNDLIIFRPGVLHRIRIDGNGAYERTDILFDEKVLASNAFNNIPQELNVVNCTENEPIIENFKRLDFYCQKFSGEDLKKLVTGLVEEIIFNLTLAAGKKDKELYVNSLADMAIEFIDRNFTNQIDIDDICNVLYISKSHLHHLFRDKLHMSPKKYINLQRLEKARNMIRAGKKPYDVYLSCGFTDYATFYRNYKLHFGHIPSAENKIEIIRDIKS